VSTLTPRDVAEDLQLSTYTVQRYFSTGVLPGFRPGGKAKGPWRITVEDYAAWKAQRRATVVDPNRIEPRSTRSQGALTRRRTA
jgi:predicted site-specific integrase-resolvase